MAPIASLVVRISGQISELQKSFADSTKAVEGFKSSFDKQAAAIQSSIDGISKTFEQFGSVVGTIGVAAVGVGAGLVAIKAGFDGVSAVVSGAVGALSDAVNHTAELGDSLFALSQKTGLSVESLSAFKFVAGQTNTSLDSISGAVFKLEANLGSGAKKTVEALSGIGLSLKDLEAQDPADAFGQIISKLGEIPNASERAAAGVAIFGKSFKDIAQLTQEDLPGLINQAKELGLVMSTETAVAADRFGDAMGAINGVLEGLQLQIGAKVMPAIVALAEVFGGVFIDGVKAATQASSGLGESFDTFVVQIGQAVGRAIEVLAKLTDATAAWVTDSTKRIADEARAFLDLAPSIITVGRALDLALSGGSHQSGFDALAKNLEALRQPLDGLASVATSAGAKIREIAQGIATSASAAGENFGATYTRIQGEISAAADKMRASLKSVGDGGAEGESKLKGFDKTLAELSKQIENAVRSGKDLPALLRLFGTEADKAATEAEKLGRSATNSVGYIAAEFRQAGLEKTLTKLDDQFSKFFSSRAEAQFKKLQASMHESGQALVDFSKLTVKAQDSLVAFGASLAQKQFEKLSAGIHDSTNLVVAQISPIRDAFKDFGDSLPELIFGTLRNGGSIVGSIATGLGAAFSKKFQEAIAAIKEAGTGALTKAQGALGAIGLGVSAFTSGFGIGAASNKTKGVLGGAATGALAGAAYGSAVPVVGTAAGALIGAGIGAIGGYFGGRSADKKAKEALEQNKTALAQQFGGMQKLSDLATKLGVDIQAAFDAKKPAQFQAAVDKLNTAIAAQEKRTQGIATALDAVNQRAATFAKQFSGLVATKAGGGDAGAVASQQIQELAQRTQPEFERISLFVRDTFAAIVRETGDAIGAINQLAPSFELLKKGITDFGLTSSGVIDSLVGTFDLVNNDAFKPFFENIQASGQLLKGLFDANVLSPDTFQAAAADIGQSIQEIINRGGDMAKTIALSAPQLQTLWEAQQRYGAVTDQTTQSILDQAVAQGVVGAQFKSVNDKILDVLLAINKVLGGDIPASAQTAADGVKGALGGALDDVSGRIRTVGGELSGTMADRAAAAGLSIKTNLGGALDGFQARGRTAADAVSIELAKIKAPDLTVKVDFDINDPKWKYQGDWNRQGGNEWHPDPIPLATGGIVRRPTLALVGEAGPEAVIPLSRLGSASQARPSGGSNSVVFREGAIVIHGPVDSDERARQVVRDFARVVRQGGQLRSLARETLGVE